MNKHQPIGGKIITPTFLVASTFTLIATYLILERYIYGLGAVTHINNGYPWGIWVAIDIVVGTAFGCGGFVIAMLVYIFNRGVYHPLVRPALLSSLFGYTLGGVAVFIDLGRYWQMYNILLPWYAQVHSVMFEVAICVATYVVVLWTEFTPVFLEKFGVTRLHQKLNKVLFVFIAIGVLLPTMHQSSLGTLMVVLGHHLSPIWNTSLLPVFFLMTAILMGYGIVVFEAIFSSLGFRRPYEMTILNKLSKIMLLLLIIFILLRSTDLFWRSQWSLAFAGDTKSVMFIIEMILFTTPALLLAKKNHTPQSLFLAALGILLAGTLYRVNVYLVGYQAAGGWHYFPSVSEILVTLGIFALEVMLYLLFVKTLPVLHTVKH